MAKRKNTPPKSSSRKVAVAVKHDELNIQVSGAFLDAKTLATLEQVSPDLRNRILKMAEQEQSHRHSLENALANADIEDMQKEHSAIKKGQWFAFITTLAAFTLSGVFAYLGYSLEGMTLGGATLSAIIIAFIRSGRRSSVSKPK